MEQDMSLNDISGNTFHSSYSNSIKCYQPIMQLHVISDFLKAINPKWGEESAVTVVYCHIKKSNNGLLEVIESETSKPALPNLYKSITDVSDALIANNVLDQKHILCLEKPSSVNSNYNGAFENAI